MTGPTLAQLGIQIDNSGVVKAITSLDGLSVAGGKSERAAQNLTRRMGLLQIEAAKMNASMGASHISLTHLVEAFGIGETAAGKLAQTLGTLGVGAIAGLFGHKMLEETIAAQNSMAQLEAGVRSTGEAAGFTAEQLHEQAKALQEVSTFSHVAIEQGQGILLLYQELKGVQFTEATKAAADLATRLGTDLPTAARQLGRALEDPAAGLNSLRRAGIVFTASQKETIKSLQDSGDLAKAQAMILDLLTQKLSGSAEAARDTLGGALKGLSHDFGDLFESTRAETSGLVDFIHATDSAVRAIGEHRATIKATGEALVIAASGATAFAIATKASTIGIAGFATAALPVIALGAAFGLLVGYMENAHEEIRQLQDDADEATKKGKPYLDYLTSLGLAHSSKGGASALAKPVDTDALIEAQKKYQQLAAEIEQQTQKQRALNGAFGESALTLAVLGIRQDEAIKNTKIDITLSAAQHAAIVGLNHELANQLVIAAKLADAEKERARNSKLAQANWQVDTDTEIAKGVTKRADAEKLLETNLAGVAAQTERIAAAQAGRDALKAIADAEAAASKKYADEMRDDWIRGFDQIIAHGMTSFRGFFSAVAEMSRHLLATMEKNSESSVFGKGAAKYTALAIESAMAGYQIGQSVYSTSRSGGGNTRLGALGGAASGAMIGGEVAGTYGAAAGALVGLTAGIIGVGNAAKEAAKAMTAAVKDVALSMAALRAIVAGDTLAQNIAAVEADRVARTKAIEDAWSGGGAGSDRVIWRTQQEKELNQLEDQRIAKLREEYAISQTYALEDLEVRKLRAQGLTKEADALARQEAADREIAQAIADHRSDEYIATLRYVTGLELATNAMDKASASALNMVSGYRLQATIFAAMAGRTSMVGSDYGSPYTTSGPQYRPPTSTAGGGDLAVTVMTPNGDVLGKTVIKDFRRRQRLGDAELAAVLS